MVAKNEEKLSKLRDTSRLNSSTRNNNQFERSTFARSSLGNYVYGVIQEDDYDFLNRNTSLSLGKIKGDRINSSVKKTTYKFPSSEFVRLTIDCPFDLVYYGLNLTPYIDEKNECTGISVISDSNNSDINLYENRRQELCQLHVADKITSYNSVFLSDENVTPDRFIQSLMRVFKSNDKVELTLSRRSNSLTKVVPSEQRIERFRNRLLQQQDSDTERQELANNNNNNDDHPKSLMIKTDLDALERIELMDRSWSDVNVLSNRHEPNETIHLQKNGSSNNNSQRKSFNQEHHHNIPQSGLRTTPLGTSSIRKLKSRSESKTGYNLTISSNQSLNDQNNPISSLRSSKKSIKDVNSFNTREIGETIEIQLSKDPGAGFGFRLVSRENLIDDLEPVFVNQISLHGPAHRDKRLKIGDRIIKLDSSTVKSFQDCIDRLKAKGPNDVVTLLISRQKTDNTDDSEDQGDALSSNYLPQDLNNNNTTLASEMLPGTPVPRILESRKNYIHKRVDVEYREPEDLTKSLGISLKWLHSHEEAFEHQLSSFIQPGFYIREIVPNTLVCPQYDTSECDLKPGDLISIVNNISLANYKLEKETLAKITQLIEETQGIFKRNIEYSLANDREIDAVVLFITVKRMKNFYAQNDRKGSSRSISSPPITKRIRDRDYLPRSELNSPSEELSGMNNNFVRDGPGRKSMSSKRPIGMSRGEMEKIFSTLPNRRSEGIDRAYKTMPSISNFRQLRRNRRAPLDSLLIKSPVDNHVDFNGDLKVETDVPPPLPLRVRSPEPKSTTTSPIFSGNSQQQRPQPQQQAPRLPLRSKSPYSSPIPLKSKVEIASPTNVKPRNKGNSLFEFVRQMKNSFSFQNIPSREEISIKKSKNNNNSKIIQRRSDSPRINLPTQKLHPNDQAYLNSSAIKESLSFPRNMNLAANRPTHQPQKNLNVQEFYNNTKQRPQRLNSYHNQHSQSRNEPTRSQLMMMYDQEHLYEEPRPSIPNRHNVLSYSDNFNHSMHETNQRKPRRGTDHSQHHVNPAKSSNSQNGHEVRYLSILKKESLRKKNSVVENQRRKTSRAII